MVEQEVMRGGQVSPDGEVRVVTASERESRLAQVKRLLAGALSSSGRQQPPAVATNEEQTATNVLAKEDSCSKQQQQQQQPRKRKERHESIGSISQERKVVRSNSEERPTVGENKDKMGGGVNGDDGSLYIRRVSSHEDFKKSQPLHERNCANNLTYEVRQFNSPSRVSPHRDPKSDFTKDDDYENERRRSTERFSRPLAPRGRRSNFGRKRKTKVFLKSTPQPTQYNNDDDIYYCKENDNSVAAANNNNNNNTNTNENSEQQVVVVSALKLNDIVKKQCTAEDIVKPTCEQPIDDPNTDLKTDLVSNFLQLHTTERERSPSPVNTPVTPALDLTTLHEQIDCSEPIPSSSSWAFTENTETLPSQSVASVRMLLSPRNSIIMTRRIYMETDVPMPNKQIVADAKTPIEQRMKHVHKQINSIKKKIKKFEEEFEMQNGYRPSHVDRMEDKVVKKMCSDLSRLRKEQKQLKEDPSSVIYNTVIKQNGTSDNTKNRTTQIKDTLDEMEKRLIEKRVTCNRSEVIEEMSGEELMDEKVAVQKALLYFESVYGRPSDKEDRDLVRPLYDRYRLLKRMVVRLGIAKMNPNVSDLATIHEHETMDFVSLPSQTAEPEFEHASTICGSTDSDTDTSIGENLHSLPLADLLEQQRITNEEKKKLRRSLKEYENEFQIKTGRKLQKDDRLPMEGVYLSYKQAKAKLRLLEALVAKHTQ